MSKNVRAILFSCLNDRTQSRLTAERTVAAIPFGGRYRMVDFALSALARAGIDRITVVANYNYSSLAEHIGSGKDWDLDRHEGGIRFLFPFQMRNGERDGMFFGHMEALLQMSDEIERWEEDHVILTDTDLLANPDLEEILRYHIASDAEVTLVTAPADRDCFAKHPMLMLRCEDGRVTQTRMSHRFSETEPEVSLGMFVMKTAVLRRMMERAATHGNPGFLRLLTEGAEKGNYTSYLYRNYAARVSSFGRYYAASMDLSHDAAVAEELIRKKGYPTETKVRNSLPTRYSACARVADCVIADGCEIGGHVTGSVLSRNVRIAPGATVENCVLMEGCEVEPGARLSCIVADENVRIRENVTLSGHPTMPFYIQKGRTVS